MTSRSSAREQIYRETYDRKQTTVRGEENLKPYQGTVQGHKVVEVQVLAAGVVERGGQQFEYHELRLYVKKP